MFDSCRSSLVRWALGSVVLVVLGSVLPLVGARSQDVGPGVRGPLGNTAIAQSGALGSTPGAAPIALAPFSPLSHGYGPLVRRMGTGPVTVDQLVGTNSVAPATFLARSRPVTLTIPRLRLSVPLSVLGLNRDGSVQVPTDFNVPGWYRFGPAPGQRGSAVILGHVDNYKGPAVFFYLRNLRPGNQVIVLLADHRVVRFVVLGLRMYTKSQFPARAVYGPRSYSALQLVTCGGVFDHATGHYLSNLVVYTKRIG